jgi:hypothetical protein
MKGHYAGQGQTRAGSMLVGDAKTELALGLFLGPIFGPNFGPLRPCPIDITQALCRRHQKLAPKSDLKLGPRKAPKSGMRDVPCALHLNLNLGASPITECEKEPVYPIQPPQTQLSSQANPLNQPAQQRL